MGFEVWTKTLREPRDCSPICKCPVMVANNTMSVDKPIVKQRRQRGFRSAVVTTTPTQGAVVALTNATKESVQSAASHWMNAKYDAPEKSNRKDGHPIQICSKFKHPNANPILTQAKTKKSECPVFGEPAHLSNLALAVSTTPLSSAGVLCAPSSATTFTSHLLMP